MKALILNSGTGTRMLPLTKDKPKCMTELSDGQTILGRQLGLLAEAGIRDVVITTGPFAQALKAHCTSMGLDLRYTYVPNPRYADTNYIYSIELAKPHLDGDLLLLHGDLVFTGAVLAAMLAAPRSCMAVSTTQPLPQKDFKAVLEPGDLPGPRILRVGISFFTDAVAAQPLYKLHAADWRLWQDRISDYCAQGRTAVYAEDALGEVTDRLFLAPLDVDDALCHEIDTEADLTAIRERLAHDER